MRVNVEVRDNTHIILKIILCKLQRIEHGRCCRQSDVVVGFFFTHTVDKCRENHIALRYEDI